MSINPNDHIEADVMAAIQKMRMAATEKDKLAEALLEASKAVKGKLIKSGAAAAIAAEEEEAKKLQDLLDALEVADKKRGYIASLDHEDAMDKAIRAVTDDIKMAETLGKSNDREMKVSQEAILKVVHALAKECEKNKDLSFVLSQPASLTIKGKDGRYRKSSFIGGEPFYLVNGYIGRRDGVICVFQEAKSMMSTSDPGTQIEIPVTHALTILDGFADAYKEIDKSPAYDSVTGDYNGKKISKDSPIMEDEIAGSW